MSVQRHSGPIDCEEDSSKHIKHTWAILEWTIPHSADCINRFLIGRDGKTAYYRIYFKNFHGKVFEFGEQVIAKVKKGKKDSKKRSLKTSWYMGTWVGYDDKSNEHIIVVKDGGPAIRVRSVRPRPESQRWNSKAIEDIIATPDKPNPADPEHLMRRVAGRGRKKRVKRGL